MMIKGDLIDYLQIIYDFNKKLNESMMKQFGLNPAEYACLLVISPEDEFNCMDLSKKLQLSHSRTSRVIDSLFKHSLVTRAKKKQDQRCLKVKLTYKGISVKQQIDSQRALVNQMLSKNMSERELLIMKKNLELLAECMATNCEKIFKQNK